MRHGRDALFWMHRARFGWFPSSDRELQVMAEDLISGMATQMDSGLYFRVTIVDRFQPFSRMLADEPVELRRPASGELLISDVPCLAVRDGHLGTGLVVVVGPRFDDLVPVIFMINVT